MTHPYIARGQQWVFALRKLMGYPGFEPSRHSTAFCSSGEPNVTGVLTMAQMAVDMGKDILNVSFASVHALEPHMVSLAVHTTVGVEWLPGCSLYAASDKAKVALLHQDKRWFFDDRNQLVSTTLPPRHRLARGEQVAWKRWRLTAARMEGLHLSGNCFVPAGRRFIDAVPIEQLTVAN